MIVWLSAKLLADTNNLKIVRDIGPLAFCERAYEKDD